MLVRATRSRKYYRNRDTPGGQAGFENYVKECSHNKARKTWLGGEDYESLLRCAQECERQLGGEVLENHSVYMCVCLCVFILIQFFAGSESELPLKDFARAKGNRLRPFSANGKTWIASVKEAVHWEKTPVNDLYWCTRVLSCDCLCVRCVCVCSWSDRTYCYGADPKIFT